MSRGTTGRAAASVAFLVNGLVLASWAPRIPQVRSALGLTNARLGLTLAAVPVGAALGAFAAPALADRVGSRGATLGAGAVLATAAAAIGWAPDAAVLALVLGVAGAADGAMDAAMNDHGAALEGALDRPLLNGLHAWWSVGAALAGVSGAVAASRGLAVTTHLAAVAAVAVALLAWAGTRMLGLPSAAAAAPGDPRRGLRVVGMVLVVATVLAAVVEEVPGDWAAVYVADHLGGGAGTAGAAFAAFAILMAVTRAVADRAVARLGRARTAATGAVAAAGGLALAALAPAPSVAVVGFGVTGVGAAVVFPYLFGTAARAAGAWGTALVSVVARVGFLAAPVVIGLGADAAGLRVAPVVGALAALVLVVMVRRHGA